MTSGSSPSIDQVKREEDYTLDALGNWKTYLAKKYTGGQWAPETDHDRTHSAASEIAGY